MPDARALLCKVLAACFIVGVVVGFLLGIIAAALAS
jgi:F0F1-type ATP synthase assembly protein I